MSKKLVQINVVCNGSTGRIMCDIAKTAEEKGYETYCFYGRGNANPNANCIKIGNKLATYFHVLITRLFDKHGHGSYFATKKLINQLRTINPDIIHLHNIHGYYLNLGLLFKYLKNEYKGKTIWTLHDCWAFTGHCSYFTMAKCNKWKNICHNCPQKKEYPKSIFLNNSKAEFKFKKAIFVGVKNLTIVTPSEWLAELVKKSFLIVYPVKVINNGINTNVFKPFNTNNIKEKFKISNNKKVILGVAAVWEERKGLKYFISLSKILDDNQVILLIGLNKKQIKTLPKNIIGIERTENINQLAEIYAMADIFFNPTLEDNYPTVNLEALSCGTPVLAFDTGGCKEQVTSTKGRVISIRSAKLIKEEIENIISGSIKKRLSKVNDPNEYSFKSTNLKYIQLY